MGGRETASSEMQGRAYLPTFRNVEAYVQKERVRTIHFGIGAIGAEVVRAVLASPDIEIAGAIDASPAKAGRDLGEAAGAGRNLGIPVQFEAGPLLRDVYADVVVHTTGSSLTEVYPQIMACIEAEKSVISSCEELAFPWARYPEIARRLHQRARETGVRVLGTGVNPGFVMDLLPLVVATASREVKSVRVERVVDTATRRIQLQRKTGAGLSVKGFQQGASAGSIGHVGLRESVFMIADTLGWALDDVTEEIEPVTAKERMRTEYFSIEKGYVSGLRQVARGLMAGREVIRLHLEMSLGAEDPHDSIELEGLPPLRVVVPGGVPGDLATAAIITNCIPAMARSRSTGLLTMRDLPAAPYFRPATRTREEAP
jgi:4-hydroxy-tetrahydrodipicolinate reductase